jgi:hypothetical protein
MTTTHQESRNGRRAAPALRGTLRLGLTVAASSALLGGVALAAVPASASAARAPHYSFRTLNNHNDPTFNQLLGINNFGKIAGYFGSGAAGHPNKGYVLRPPYHQLQYRNQNFPHSAQTQVTGLNDGVITVGFWVNGTNANFGFYAVKGRKFHSVNFPTHNNASPPVNQLLGVNDRNVAAGFYTDSTGNNHGYLYSIGTKKFRRVHVSGATSVTATAINNRGNVAGFFVNSTGATKSFLLRHSGQLIKFAFPGATITQAFGLNDLGEVVGVYTLSSTVTHGFTWTQRHGFRTVNDPHGVNTTIINGVNDLGDLVGFYVDAGGNTDGLLATP